MVLQVKHKLTIMFLSFYLNTMKLLCPAVAILNAIGFVKGLHDGLYFWGCVDALLCFRLVQVSVEYWSLEPKEDQKEK